MTFTINSGLVSILNREMDKFSKKFNKYGEGSFIYEVSDPYIADSKNSTHEQVVDVEIEANYKVGDYKFVASLEYDDNSKSNIIKKPNGEDDNIPEIYRNRCTCDHCKIERARKHTVLLKDNATGEYIQVGKSCLKDFLGVDKVSYASYLSSFDSVSEYLESLENRPDNTYRPNKVFEYDFIVGEAFEYIKRFGYTKSSDDGISTARRIIMAINGDKNRYGNPIEEIYEISDETKSQLEELKSMLKEADDSNSDYVHNIKVIGSHEYVQSESFGLAVSSACWYFKEKELFAKKKNSKKSEYIGTVGSKITFKSKAECIFSTETQYGYVYIYRFMDKSNVIVWKTSKSVDHEKEYTVSGTIKELSEYRGVKQTVVTRCRLAEN